jgi:hypothetical protein
MGKHLPVGGRSRMRHKKYHKINSLQNAPEALLGGKYG